MQQSAVRDNMSGDFFASTSVSTNCSSSASVACSSTRWITEEVFKLIDMVQHDEAIYNPRHKYYFCRPYVENFWREVDQKLEKNPGASLAKWTNLRISFRREYTNYLEEKVPPCWSYFDRMFFLHPFLRKKQHQSPKSLDTQVQDALVHMSSLSSRLQRERCLATAAAGSASNASSTGLLNSSTAQQQQLDSYFEYFDEGEHNTPELDDIMEEEQQSRFRLHNDIKSECEDAVDDFELDQVQQVPVQLDDAESREAEIVEPEAVDVTAVRNFVYGTLAANSDKRQQLRLQHLNRLQTRSYHDELRAKRPRSQESISSSQTAHGSSMHNHANVSFVRPTFSKTAHVEAVSTTSGSTPNTAPAHHHHHHHHAQQPVESVSVPATLTAQTTQQARNHQCLEISSISSASVAATGNTTAAPPTVELCDCKTDSDAMFLMSLLPDIQKLNGRDRGKIKIAFQNILQDYLYPD